MKLLGFEFGLDKSRYFKRAGETIDIYSSEHEGRLNYTEELVKDVAHMYLITDILKGAITVGGILSCAVLGTIVWDCVSFYIGKKAIAKLIGGTATLSTILLGDDYIIGRTNRIDEWRDEKINAMLEKALAPDPLELVVEIVDDVPPADDENANDATETVSVNVRKVAIFGGIVYMVLGCIRWALETFASAVCAMRKVAKVMSGLRSSPT